MRCAYLNGISGPARVSVAPQGEIAARVPGNRTLVSFQRTQCIDPALFSAVIMACQKYCLGANFCLHFSPIGKVALSMARMTLMRLHPSRSDLTLIGVSIAACLLFLMVRKTCVTRRVGASKGAAALPFTFPMGTRRRLNLVKQFTGPRPEVNRCHLAAWAFTYPNIP